MLRGLSNHILVEPGLHAEYSPPYTPDQQKYVPSQGEEVTFCSGVVSGRQYKDLVSYQRITLY